MDISKLSKKKKIGILIAFIALGVLAIGGIVGVFSLNYNTFLPSAPSILDDGKSIIITTRLNENYQGYRFRFQSTGSDVTIESKDNILTQTDIEASELVVGTTYRVSVCYLGETEGGGTEYSDSVSWVYSKYLSSPIISHDQLNQIISWQEVEKADYYTIHYKDGHEYKSDIVTDLIFDYSTMEGGDKEFYVVAHSVKSGYKTSEPSEILKFVHTYRLKEIKEATFDEGSYYLTVKAQEKIGYLSVYLDQQQHVAKLSDYTREGNLYVYKVNIVTKYTEGVKIGVAPYPPSKYYSFTGNILYI